jgi:hypothetical protein
MPTPTGVESVEWANTSPFARTFVADAHLYSASPAECNTYDLTIDTACTEDPLENDDSSFDANLLTVGGPIRNLAIVGSDDDWFEFELEDGESVTVNLTFAHAAGDLQFSIYNDALDPFGTVNTATDNEATIVTNGDPTPLTIFLKVEMNGGTCNVYDIGLVANP